MEWTYHISSQERVPAAVRSALARDVSESQAELQGFALSYKSSLSRKACVRNIIFTFLIIVMIRVIVKLLNKQAVAFM